MRLAGIDAPERGQSCWLDTTPRDCGQVASEALAALIGGGAVDCTLKGEDRYGRRLGVCFNAGGRDLNAALVRSGMAVAFGAYADEERFAGGRAGRALVRRFRAAERLAPPARRSRRGAASADGWLFQLWQWLSGLWA